MNGLIQQDTIAAVSTPQGRGGIAVVRLSGADGLRIVSSCFQGRVDLSEASTHTAHHGWIVEDGEPVDEVVVTLFRAPASFTGEDVVEISCHGGIFVSRRLLDLMIDRGARPARPGEFSMRAFLNGKMDLSQAEAVADLIEAKTEAARRVAVNALKGRLSERCREIREGLIRICAALEVELDFAEEDAGEMSRDEIRTIIESTRTAIRALLETYERGKVCREGVRLVIVGRPNVGKSSILNALVEKERAIVTEVPGTTRDTVDEPLDIEGLLFHVTDTAGLRESGDPLEREGVRRTEHALAGADLILLVFDGSEPFKPEDRDIVRRLEGSSRNIIVVINKTDLKGRLDRTTIATSFPGEELITVSALTRSGMTELIKKLRDRALTGEIPETGEAVLTRARHRDLLRRADGGLSRAETSLGEGMSPEFVVLDIREALVSLGELIGVTTTDDILERIFSDFCIGK